jgi:hypothetical protein
MKSIFRIKTNDRTATYILTILSIIFLCTCKVSTSNKIEEGRYYWRNFDDVGYLTVKGNYVISEKGKSKYTILGDTSVVYTYKGENARDGISPVGKKNKYRLDPNVYCFQKKYSRSKSYIYCLDSLEYGGVLK